MEHPKTRLGYVKIYIVTTIAFICFWSENVLSLIAVKGFDITVSTFFIASKDLKDLGILTAKSGRMVVKKLLTLFANWLWSVVVLVSAGL